MIFKMSNNHTMIFGHVPHEVSTFGHSGTIVCEVTGHRRPNDGLSTSMVSLSLLVPGFQESEIQ